MSVPDAPLCVRGDASRLEQVVGNLVTNAAKYTDRGGRISVSIARVADDAVLRVADNGTGISPDALPRVFDLFIQADGGVDRSRGGLGIGLTVVRRLVELHGGRVDAFSEGFGTGSEFVITLPLQPTPPSEASVPAPLSPVTQNPVRLLLVEDNVDAADALMMLLSAVGHEVDVARDGLSALAALQASEHDVALVDIGLPGMDGYEVARRVRALPLGWRVVLVALTGYGRDEDKRAALAAGFDHHLTKPVELEALRDLVARFTRAPDRSRS